MTKTHTDVTYVLVLDDKERVLVVKNYQGSWSLPGGKRENGETLQQAAVREAWEEAGARVEIKNIVCVSETTKPEQRHLTFFVFQATLIGNINWQSNNEIEAIDWVDLETASRLMPWYPKGVKQLTMASGALYFQDVTR